MIKDKKNIVMFVLGFILVVVVILSALIGSHIGCERGGGHDVGFKCVDFNVVDVCVHQGHYYLFNESNSTFNDY